MYRNQLRENSLFYNDTIQDFQCLKIRFDLTCANWKASHKHNFVKIVVFGNTQIAIKKKYLEPNILHNSSVQTHTKCLYISQ